MEDSNSECSSSSCHHPTAQTTSKALSKPADRKKPNAAPHSDKLEQILHCLNGRAPSDKKKRWSLQGNNDRNSLIVDKWQLRQLAFTPGGFLDPEVRRKVWPILVGIEAPPEAEEAEHSSPTSSPSYELSSEERTIIHQDVGRSVWHVEKEIKRLSLSKPKPTPPSSPTPCDASDGYSSSSESSTTPTTPTRTKPFPFTSPNSTSPSQIPHTRKNEELNMLSTTITSILQSSHGKLNYYQGFHDLVALFLINLQNSTLTSDILQNLASTHLRDQTKISFAELSAAMQLTIFPVLSQVDRELHDFLVEEIQIDNPTFALSWILSWFCHDVLEVNVASRLVDVFIVSHPLMPLYMSVAIMIYPPHREKIVNAECEFAEVHQVLLNLPKEMLLSHKVTKSKMTNNDDEEDVFEQVIALTLEIMDQIPPHKIPMIAQTYRNNSLRPYLKMLSSISLFQNPKSLLLERPIPSPKNYPMAIVASGLRDVVRHEIKCRKRRKRRIVSVFLMLSVAIWMKHRRNGGLLQEKALVVYEESDASSSLDSLERKDDSFYDRQFPDDCSSFNTKRNCDYLHTTTPNELLPWGHRLEYVDLLQQPDYLSTSLLPVTNEKPKRRRWKLTMQKYFGGKESPLIGWYGLVEKKNDCHGDDDCEDAKTRLRRVVEDKHVDENE